MQFGVYPISRELVNFWVEFGCVVGVSGAHFTDPLHERVLLINVSIHRTAKSVSPSLAVRMKLLVAFIGRKPHQKRCTSFGCWL